VGIIHTGTWEWGTDMATSTPDGDCAANPMTCTSWWFGTLGHPSNWGIGYDGFTHLALAALAGRLTHTVTDSLRLDGVVTDPQMLPAGIRFHDDYTFQFGTTGPPPVGNFHMNVKFTVLGIDEDIYDFGASHVYALQLSGFGDDSALNLLAVISISGWMLEFNVDSPAYPTGGGTNVQIQDSAPPKWSGVYDIIYWWWQLKDKDACGNRLGVSHLVFAGDAPVDGDYDKMDPSDPDAHPTPVVTVIEPDHGGVAGGDRVVIQGSGFGDGATVTFNGSSATGVDVQSQYRIECDAPAHAAGATTVVVTNVDGFHS
jgi:hypothetical protein